MSMNRTRRLILALTLGAALFASLILVTRTSVDLLGRILEGDELLRIQVEADFDTDLDIDFVDFTMFSAFYEES